MDCGVIINSALTVLCLILAFIFPWKMGWPGIFASHFATLFGFLLMGAVNTFLDPTYYEDGLTVLGLLIFAFAFNLVVLPVSLTGCSIYQKKKTTHVVFRKNVSFPE